LCDEDLSTAIKKINSFKNPKTDKTELKEFPVVWYVWGNKNKNLDSFKNRFQNLKTSQHFFYDNTNEQISFKFPTSKCFAKHTQGLRHDNVVPYLSKVLNKQLLIKTQQAYE
jgi:hypothetical protein